MHCILNPYGAFHWLSMVRHGFMLPSIPYDVPDINMKLPRLDTSLANYILLFSFLMLRVSLVHVFSIHSSIAYYN